MKTKMIRITLAAVLGIAGVTSAYAQNLNYDSNEWIEQAVASKSQAPQSNSATNAAPQAANDRSTPCLSNCH